MDMQFVKDKLEKKQLKYKEQGYADKEFEKEVNGKKIKMWLPSSVFDQQKLLMLSDSVILSTADFETNLDLTNKYYSAICKYMLLAGNVVNPEILELAQLQAYSILYWVELLRPLSQWGDTVVQEIVS